MPNGTGGAKFMPVIGTDTMIKNNTTQQISTKHQCITAMKEFEQKSLEVGAPCMHYGIMRSAYTVEVYRVDDCR